MRSFENDDPGYLAWLETHPHGFVVNTFRTPDPRYLILHCATCGSIGGKPTTRRNWTTHQYMKICSGNRADLDHGAHQTTGGSLHPCGLCKPD